MADFNVSNFVIDHVLSGAMIDTKYDTIMWQINQITDPALNVSSETSEAVDALGTPIATFNRSKKSEFSASNALFDLGLFAAQNGVEKKVASASAKVVVPMFEAIVVPASTATPVSLKHTPLKTPQAIYQLKGDGTLGEKLVYNSGAGAGKFTYATGQITFPTDAKAGAEYFVQYEYEAERAVAVTGDAMNYPRAGKFVMEVLGTDVCDPSTLIHAYIVFPNAKLDANVDITFSTDGKHPFKLIAQQAYCDKQKTLFSIVIPDEE
ncbi:hypothetical protein [Clostridium sp.]|uniref:hypothetical protein n=1 Tax=Clostridium sp. TaxID=1506 RepID=UPI003216D49C